MPGSHATRAVNWGGGTSLNGAGLSHLVFPTEIERTSSNPTPQTFGCDRAWSWSVGRSAVRACTVTITLPWDAIVVAEVAGHYKAHGRGCFFTIAYDDDNAHSFLQNTGTSNEWGNRMVHYGESSNWEAVFFKRGKVLAAGTHTVAVWGKGTLGSCGLNGFGMDGKDLDACPARSNPPSPNHHSWA